MSRLTAEQKIEAIGAVLDERSELRHENTVLSARIAELLKRVDELETISSDVRRALAELREPRPIAEYDEDMGDVLWWCFERDSYQCKRCSGDGHVNRHANEPDVRCEDCDGKGLIEIGPLKRLGEPPYVGSPNDLGHTVEAHVELRKFNGNVKGEPIRMMLGGWPGYHTHFTPLPRPHTRRAP